jgi:protein-tyrosine phosphatase
MAGWRRSGVDVVLSLLTAEEEVDLDLRAEEREAKAHGLEFWSFPIPDREVPASESQLTSALERVDRALAAGKNVVVHCRQGVGRTGLVAACLLVSKGIAPEPTIRALRAVRGATIPETAEQRHWIDHYAATTSPR